MKKYIDISMLLYGEKKSFIEASSCFSSAEVAIATRWSRQMTPQTRPPFTEFFSLSLSLSLSLLKLWIDLIITKKEPRQSESCGRLLTAWWNESDSRLKFFFLPSFGCHLPVCECVCVCVLPINFVYGSAGLQRLITRAGLGRFRHRPLKGQRPWNDEITNWNQRKTKKN